MDSASHGELTKPLAVEDDLKSLLVRNCRPHGQRLSSADRDRISQFVYDFVVRALIPWVENTMRSLNDQVRSTKSL